MLYYKINIIEELKKAGYNTTVIRRRRLINENSLTAIRRDKPISWSTLEKICDLLNCQPGDILGSRQEEPQISLDEHNEHAQSEEEQEQEEELPLRQKLINQIKQLKTLKQFRSFYRENERLNEMNDIYNNWLTYICEYDIIYNYNEMYYNWKSGLK